MELVKTKKFPCFFLIAPNSWSVFLGVVLFLATVPISHVRRQDATPQASRWLYHQPPWRLPRKKPPSPGKPWEGAAWPLTSKSGPIGGGGRHCWANQKRLIFFCVQIYLHLWMYLSTPLTHLQNGIPHLLQNGGAWHWHMILFSYKVMLGVYKQVFFYKMECPDGTQISIKTDL